MTAAVRGSAALTTAVPATAWIIALIGINNSSVTPIPINPEKSPIIRVSEIKT